MCGVLGEALAGKISDNYKEKPLIFPRNNVTL